MKVLLVDDDQDLLDLLAFALNRAGFTVATAAEPQEALEALDGGHPDLAVLDLNLGPASGFDVLKALRERTKIPVIMLTGRDAEDDKVLGLELGADDYMTKPFSHRELIARIQVHLKRRGQWWSAPRPADTALALGPLTINTRDHTVLKNGEPVSLSVAEFRLLSYLASNAGVVVPAPALLKQVWGQDDPSGKDLVRITIHRLRRKIEDDPAHPRLLQTVRGIGFMAAVADKAAV
jgi:two-component system response regulator RegX3